MPFVLITCPVYDRAWILGEWFNYIEQQDFPMSQLGFLFECAPNDYSTIDCLVEFSKGHPELRCFDIRTNDKQPHRTHPEGFRTWTRDHYHAMVSFRNNLLDRAVGLQPDRVFSLDTDVLLENPSTISELYDLTARPEIDTASPLMFMMPDNIFFPNVMSWNTELRGYRKPDYPLGTLFKADIIMAAVMMKKSVYSKIRYKWHSQGEDLGFAAELRNANFTSYSASDIYTDHVMSRKDLEIHKIIGDPRKILLKEKFPKVTII